MKLIANNISPLPFYGDISFQNHRKDYAFGQVYQLITYKNMLMPFQVVIPQGTSVESVKLHDFNASSHIDITNSLKENGLIIKPYNTFKILKYPGILPILEIKHEGLYYLEITISDLGTIYSDVFSSVNRVSDFLYVEYSNSFDIYFRKGLVDFSDGFKFKCYLDTQVGKPEYSFEEEATERMGYTFVESQVSKKTYKFTFLAPEYLCDALRIIRLCDNKKITSKGISYDLSTFSMEPKWEDQGDLAAVECEFETDDTIMVNIGGYTPDINDRGDFNADYNGDFKSKNAGS